MKQHDFETLFTVIAKTESVKEIPREQFTDYLNKFLERERDMKKLKETGVGSVKENFDVVREKIKRFYNMDSSVFYQDLLTFAEGNERQVKFSELKKYLAFSNIQLSDNENSALGLAFKAVGSTMLSIDYVTSMIFFGKANLQTLNMAERSQLMNLFFNQIRAEMNLYKHSSYDIFQDFLAVISTATNELKQTIGRLDFEHVIQSKRLGLNKDEIGELFHEIAGVHPTFDYKTFRTMLYGKELDDVTNLVFRIDERVQSKGINLTDHFYKYGQAEITFREFAECLLDIDPNLKYDEVDMLFCKIDVNADCKVSSREFENLMIHHSILNDFKYHLTTYARKNAKELLDILYMTGNTYDGLLREEFNKLVKEITEGSFTAEQTNKLFFALDRNKDGSISKTELSEILDLAQKQIYNIREFLTFRNGVAEYCEKLKINLQILFDKYADESKKLTKAGLNKMTFDTVKYAGTNTSLIQKVLDSNLSDTIDIREFKTGMIGPEINADEIILTMRRIIAANQFNIEKLFNDFAASNRLNLDYFEFTNVIKALGMRLTFYELERIFDVLSIGQKDHITKQEFITALSGQDQHHPDRSIVSLIQDFKAKVDL